MLLRLLRTYLARHRRDLTLVIVFQALQTLATLYLPSLNADIIDKGIATGDRDYIWRTGLLMLAVSLGQIIASIIATYFAARASMGAGRDIRADVFGKVSGFSEREVSQFGAGSLITRNTNDVQQVQMLVLMGGTLMVAAPIMMVGGIIMAAREDVGLSWLVLAVVPVLGVSIGLIIRQMRDQGLQAPMMSGDGIVSAEFTSIAGPGADGTLMTFAPDPRKNPNAKDAVAKFKAKNFEPEAYTLYSYAAAQILADAQAALEEAERRHASQMTTAAAEFAERHAEATATRHTLELRLADADTARQHADHRTPRGVELDAAPDDVGIRAEAHLPEVVADHHDRGAASLQFTFEPFDGGEVEMVGRLVEQENIRRGREHPRQRRAPRLAAGEAPRVLGAGEAERIEHLPRLMRPVVGA